VVVKSGLTVLYKQSFIPLLIMNLFILVDYSQIEILVENFVDDIFLSQGEIIVLEPHQTSFKH
jgi:hypothetical protein